MTVKIIIAAAPLLAGCLAGAAVAQSAAPEAAFQEVEVSGYGVHRFSEVIEHSREATDSGEIVRSTDIIDLFGDLRGQILYHPVSVYDYHYMTLVNTGHQVFSGVILGSEPVMLYDDTFRFEVNLLTGETKGEVYLDKRIAGPKARCDLNVTGAGFLPNGDAKVNYTGTCRIGAGGKDAG